MSILCLILLPSSLYAGEEDHKIFSAELQAHAYNDLTNNNTQTKQILKESYTGNLNLRFYRIFSLIVSGLTSPGDDRVAVGLGIKVDLPGFLFFGANSSQLLRQSKNPTVNTYWSWIKYVVDEPSLNAFVSDRIGFGLDIFLNKMFYANGELMSYSHRGNQYLALGLGLGIEF